MYQIFAALVSLFSAVLYTFIWSAITGKSASLGLSTGLLSLVRTVSFITFSCVSFEDGPNAHTNAFALYCVSTLAWIHTIQSKLITRDTKLNGQRRRLRDAYLGSMVLCTIFFYRHQVKQVKYAYSLCSIFQWAMMAIDVVFDHLFAKELRDVALHVDFPLLDKRHIV